MISVGSLAATDMELHFMLLRNDLTKSLKVFIDKVKKVNCP